MKKRPWLTGLILLSLGSMCAPRVHAAEPLKQGDRIPLGDKAATLLFLDTLPTVSNPITEHQQFDRYGDPMLEKLRQNYHLDDVVAAGHDEFEKQLLLMEWVHNQIQYGDPAEFGKVRDPLKLLQLSQKGTVLYCECFASVFIASAASMGWVARPIDIPTHSFTEIWSNQYRKWIMMDPTSNFYVEKAGLPLDAYAMRKEWFEHGEKALVFKRGRERNVCVGRGFGGYTVLNYMFRREWLGTRPEGGGLSVFDGFSGGRKAPYPLVSDPVATAYPPVDQASLSLVPPSSTGDQLNFMLSTWTPNFKTFRIREDNGAWVDTPAAASWTLHAGLNILEAESVNLFGVAGPVSTAEVYVADRASRELLIPGRAFSGEGGGGGGGGGHVGVRSFDASVDPAYVSHWNTAGHWLEWHFQSPADGEYDITLNAATLFHPARELTFNGQPIQNPVTGDRRFSIAPTLRWDHFSESRLPVRVHVRKGANRLRLACLDDLTELLAEIRLTNPKLPDIVIPATSYAAEGGGEARRMISPTQGFFRFWDAKGHWLEWKIEAPAAGSYTAFMQYGSLFGAQRDLTLNGQSVPGMPSFPLPRTTDWQTWGEAQLALPLPLDKGQNILRLTNSDGEGVNLAGIRLVAADSSEIDTAAVGFSAQEGGQVTAVAPDRNHYLYNWNAKGHWLEWTVRPVAAGDYTVILRAACERETAHELQINGQTPQGLANFSLPATGGAQSWQELQLPAPIHLNAGDNTLRLTNLAAAGLNLDQLRLIPVDARK